MVTTYFCSRLVCDTGVATGGSGRSRWNGSNGVLAAERTTALVRLPLGRVRLSNLNEQTNAMPPKPRVSAARRVRSDITRPLRA